FSTPFSHATENTEFERAIRPHLRSSEVLRIERDMEAAGQDPAVYWPRGVLQWVWSHPGEYVEVRRVARG
ncbi:hypothetical protein CC86DRAFT_263443, partial [Ophiobolus disseminans]